MLFSEYVAVVHSERLRQAERDRLARHAERDRLARHAERDRLAQFAAAVRACCNPSRIRRILAALRREPAPSGEPAPCGC